MDMYQKRKMRQEKKNSESNRENLHNVPINWLMEEEEKTLSNRYKMGVKLLFLFTLF